jgi:prephenate dehydratase
MRVAIQGANGSFHHQAAMQLGPTDDILSCDTFAQVFGAVMRGTADKGLVAIENNLHGSINEVYRLLERHDVWITNDIRMRIDQNLIGHPDVTLEELAQDPNTRVLSQAPALAQVELWLDEHLPSSHREETHDTALSVRMVMENAVTHNVAVAGAFAAETHNGHIIASNIQDDPGNFTRFIEFQKDKTANEGATHASIILKTDHAAGSLLRALQVFAECEANLTKLDSHPIPGDDRHYAFYIDYELPEQQEALLEALAAQGCEVKLLGEYVSVDQSKS